MSRSAIELLTEIYDVTSARDRRGEPEIGGDFKIAVEYLLGIEDEMRAALLAAGVALGGPAGAEYVDSITATPTGRPDSNG